MVPIPRAASWEALNEQFIRDAMARRAQRLRGPRRLSANVSSATVPRCCRLPLEFTLGTVPL